MVVGHEGKYTSEDYNNIMWIFIASYDHLGVSGANKQHITYYTAKESFSINRLNIVWK